MKNDVIKFKKYLIETNSLKFGDFILSSGRKSSYYIDLRNALSYPHILNFVAEYASRVIKAKETINFDKILGIATGGIAPAIGLAIKLNMCYGYIRDKRKSHGTGKIIEGNIDKSDRLLLVDDVLTSGKSLTNAIQILSSEGYNISAVIVIVDREEGGKDILEKQGIPVIDVFKISDLLD